MSYLFLYGQLHPRDCGLGLVGPDQPWTKETASKVLVAAQEPCNESTHVLSKLSEFATPMRSKDGQVVVNEDCFQTGQVFEAKTVGNPRSVQWCCRKEVTLPPRPLTASEMEQWGGQCGLQKDPISGQYQRMAATDKVPQWRQAGSYIPASCNSLSFSDAGYELHCCPTSLVNLLPGTVFSASAIPTIRAESSAEQIEAERVAIQEEISRREAIIQQNSAGQGSFLQRYGFPLLLVAGTVGIGVTAALFKRFSVSSKQAKEAKSAIAALQKNTGEWWPPQSVGDNWDGPPLRPGAGLDVQPVSDVLYEVYWTCPRTKRRDFLGAIIDREHGRYRYYAQGAQGHTGTHQNIDDAAAWLAQRTWRVIEGEK